MSAKKEKLIKITKDEDGSEVRVYKEFDQENPYFTGEPRFIHKENDNAEEVEMQPFEINIDELKEKQDMWLLYPDGALENKMDLKISIQSDYAFIPKEWLNENNWALKITGHFMFSSLLRRWSTGKKIMSRLLQKQREHFNY